MPGSQPPSRRPSPTIQAAPAGAALQKQASLHAHGYDEEGAASAGIDMTQEEYYVPR